MQRRDFLGLGLAAAAGPVLAQRPSYQLSPWPERLATPSLEALDLQGKTWRLAELRGRAVVLNFWATWCPPCRAEMPSLQQLGEIYGPEQLQVLAVNVGEGPRAIHRYLKSSALNLTVLLDPQQAISRQWGANALPTTILIGADGRARHRVIGEVDWSGSEAAAWIEPLLPSRGRKV